LLEEGKKDADLRKKEVLEPERLREGKQLQAQKTWFHTGKLLKRPDAHRANPVHPSKSTKSPSSRHREEGKEKSK